LPLNEGTVTLKREEVVVPGTVGEGQISLVPYHAGETLNWRFVG